MNRKDCEINWYYEIGLTSRHLSRGLRKTTTTLVSGSGFELWTSKLQSRSADVCAVLPSQDKAVSY